MRWYEQDGLGSVVGLSNYLGFAVGNYRYDAYGQPMPTVEGVSSRFGYTGQAWDTKTGLLHFFAREYEPRTANWLSADQYRGERREPRSMQRYGYVHANPVNFVDPLGFCEWWEFWCVIDTIIEAQYVDIQNAGSVTDQSDNMTTSPLPAPSYFSPAPYEGQLPESLDYETRVQYEGYRLVDRLLPDAAGVRGELGYSNDPAKSFGVGGGGSITFDFLYNRRSGEFSVFASPGVSLIAGGTLPYGAGVICAWNLPSNMGYRGGFWADGGQLSLPSKQLGITGEVFRSAPTSPNGAVGTFFGVTAREGLPAGVYEGYSYGVELYNSHQGLLPNPPSAQTVVSDIASAARERIGPFLPVVTR